MFNEEQKMKHPKLEIWNPAIFDKKMPQLPLK